MSLSKAVVYCSAIWCILMLFLGRAEIMAFIFNLNDTHCQVLWICYVKPYQVLLNTAVSTSDFGLVFPGVCSVFGNSTLLYISYKKKHLLKPAEYFIINLAVSDLGLTVTLYPMAITSSFYHRYTSEVIAPPNQSKMANTKVAGDGIHPCVL